MSKAIFLLSEDADAGTVTMSRAQLESILDEFEDLEDRIALLEHKLAPGKALSVEEAERIIFGADK